MRKTLAALAVPALLITMSACSFLPSMRSPEARLGDTVGQPASVVREEIEDLTCDMLDDGYTPVELVDFYVDNYYMVPFSPERMGDIIADAVVDDCPSHMSEIMEFVNS